MIDIILVVIIIILAVLLLLAFRRGQRTEYDPYEEMEGRDFEYYCADLLKERGFLQVEVTKGSRDFGADILAEKDGVSYAIQCKRYDGPVGVHAVQEAYAGKDYYGCMVGAVMTNQYFTEPAVELATKLKIMLWDRDYIGEE